MDHKFKVYVPSERSIISCQRRWPQAAGLIEKETLKKRMSNIE